MLKRFVDGIATSPATDGTPRRVVLALLILITVFVAIDVLTWLRDGSTDVRQLITGVGMLLLMLFFYSRQRQIRLVAYFVGAACLFGGVLRDLHRFLVG